MQREEADRAAEAIARRMGIGEKPELLRFASNAVYRAGDAVLRVSPEEADKKYLQQQIDLALFLSSKEFPTARPLRRDPEEAEGLIVSRWQFLPGGEGWEAGGRKIGQLLRHFHDSSEGYGGELPRWGGPQMRVSEKLETNEFLSDKDLRLLLRWQEVILERAENIRFDLPQGPVHGDFNISNIICQDDNLFLIDFDRALVGPREWDLVQLLRAEMFFGEKVPAGFYEGYGWRPDLFEGLETLVALKVIFSMAWLASQEPSDWKREETERRMQFWRDPSSNWPMWQSKPRDIEQKAELFSPRPAL